MIKKDLLDIPIFKEHHKELKKLKDTRYNEPALKLYGNRLSKIYEYTFNLITNIFTSILYDDTENQVEKTELIRSWLYSRDSLLTKYTDEIKASLKLSEKQYYSLEKIEKLTKIFRQIRNTLTHTNEVAKVLSIAKKEYNTLEDNFKSLAVDSTKEIWTVSSNLLKLLQKELPNIFHSDSVFTSDYTGTTLNTVTNIYKTSPLIILENNDIYVLYSLSKDGKELKGLCNSIINKAKYFESDELVEFSKPAKFGSEIIYKDYLYYGRQNEASIKLFRYDINDRREVKCKVTLNHKGKTISEITTVLPAEDNEVIEPINFLIPDDFQDDGNIRVDIDIIYKNKRLQNMRLYKPILCQREGSVDFLFQLPTAKNPITDGITNKSLLIIENTGNIHKTVDLEINSSPNIQIELSDAKKENRTLNKIIELNPEEIIIEELTFTSKIYGQINNAIEVKLKENGETINRGNIGINVYKRFEATKIIDRENLLNEIKSELEQGKHAVQPGMKLWCIIGQGGVGKSKLSEEISSFAEKFEFQVLMLFIRNQEKTKDTESKGNTLVESFMNINCNSELYFQMRERINIPGNIDKDKYEQIVQNALEDFLVNYVREAKRKKLVLIIDDAQNLTPASSLMLEKVLNNLPERLVAEELKIIIMSRPSDDLPKIDNESIRYIEGFDNDEFVIELLEDLFMPNDFPRHFAVNLWSETKGIPFYLRELIRQMYDQGKIETIEGKWTLKDSEIPNTKELKKYLIKSAINKGKEFEDLMGFIAALPDMEEDKLEQLFYDSGYSKENYYQVIDELLRVGIIKRNANQLRFSHDLYYEGWFEECSEYDVENIINVLWNKWDIDGLTNKIVEKNGNFYKPADQEYMREKLVQLKIITQLITKYPSEKYEKTIEELFEIEAHLFAWFVPPNFEFCTVSYEYLYTLFNFARSLINEGNISYSTTAYPVLAETSCYLYLLSHDLYKHRTIEEVCKIYDYLLKFENSINSLITDPIERVRFYLALAFLSAYMIMDLTGEKIVKEYINVSRRFLKKSKIEFEIMKNPPPFLISSLEVVEIMIVHMEIFRSWQKIEVKRLAEIYESLSNKNLKELPLCVLSNSILSKLIISITIAGHKEKSVFYRLLNFKKYYKKTLQEIKMQIENDPEISSSISGETLLLYSNVIKSVLILYTKKISSKIPPLEKIIRRWLCNLENEKFSTLIEKTHIMSLNITNNIRKTNNKYVRSMMHDIIIVLAILLKIVDPDSEKQFDVILKKIKEQFIILMDQNRKYWSFVVSKILNLLHEEDWQKVIKEELGINKELEKAIDMLEEISE